MDLGTKLVGTAHLGHRHHPQYREADRREQEADKGSQPLGTGLIAHIGREDQVASPEEHGKQGDAHQQQLFPLQLFHRVFPARSFLFLVGDRPGPSFPFSFLAPVPILPQGAREYKKAPPRQRAARAGQKGIFYNESIFSSSQLPRRRRNSRIISRSSPLFSIT